MRSRRAIVRVAAPWRRRKAFTWCGSTIEAGHDFTPRNACPAVLLRGNARARAELSERAKLPEWTGAHHRAVSARRCNRRARARAGRRPAERLGTDRDL